MENEEDRKIKDTDTITIDMGAKYKGYCSDMTRNIIMKNADSEIRNLYEIVKYVQEEVIRHVKEGVYTKELYNLAEKMLNNRGYRQLHGLGHSLGIDIHEVPSLSPNTDTMLKCGMVITIEPGVYIKDRFGIRVEDTVLVTKLGCEVLTKSEK